MINLYFFWSKVWKYGILKGIVGWTEFAYYYLSCWKAVILSNDPRRSNEAILLSCAMYFIFWFVWVEFFVIPGVAIWKFFAQHIVSVVDNPSGSIRLQSKTYARPVFYLSYDFMPAASRVSQTTRRFASVAFLKPSSASSLSIVLILTDDFSNNLKYSIQELPVTLEFNHKSTLSHCTLWTVLAQLSFINEPIENALKKLEGAYAPHTLLSYYADAHSFVEWFNDRGIE